MTTAYHPNSNGMVERFHSTAKNRNHVYSGKFNWVGHLPLILLGIRTTVKEDLGCSAAELVFGTTVRLPGELVYTQNILDIEPSTFVQRLRVRMKNIRHTPPRPHSSRVQISPDLQSCEYVFVRHDAVRKPLQPPYDGPYKVLVRAEKFFKIQRTGKTDNVSIDRLKPALIEHSDDSVPPKTSTSHSVPTLPPSCAPTLPTSCAPTFPTCAPTLPTSCAPTLPTSCAHTLPKSCLAGKHTSTRGGRHVSWPKHLADYST